MEFVFNGKFYDTDKPVYILLFKHMDNSWQDCHGNRHGASVGFFSFGKSEISGKNLSFKPVIREGIISRIDFSQKDGINSVTRFFVQYIGDRRISGKFLQAEITADSFVSNEKNELEKIIRKLKKK